jgi:hypothetical protein
MTGTQDSINIILRTNTSSDTIAGTRSNGTGLDGQLGTAGISGVTLGNGTFYLEMIRESGSDYKLYIRSGSHTGTLLGTGSYTDASGVTGLQYIKTGRLYSSVANGNFVAKWEDIEFYNNTTSTITPATWTYEPNANSSPLFDTHNGTNTSDSTTITVASNANRLLIAHVGHSSNLGNAATTVTSVTSNVSGAFTQLMTQNSDATTNNKTDVWYLKAPATGAHTVTVVYSHSTGSRTIALTSLYNVDQITPINLSSKAGNGSSTGTPITVDITPTVKNSVLMALCQAQYSQNTPSDTSIYMSSYVGGGDFSISAQKKLSPTKDSVNTMSWVKNSNAAWSIVAFEVIGV